LRLEFLSSRAVVPRAQYIALYSQTTEGEVIGFSWNIGCLNLHVAVCLDSRLQERCQK